MILRNVNTIIRFLFIAVANSVGIFLFSIISQKIEIESFAAAVLFTIFISIFNSAIYPIFAKLTLPLTVLTLGIGSLIINAAMILLIANIIPGIKIDGVWGYIIFIFGITIVNTLVSKIFAIDDDEVYYRNVIKRQAKKNKNKSNLKTPGIIFLQIDGLGYSVLRKAIGSGDAPNIARLIRNGEYRLEKWETDWSSQTGASQAGILMGSNKNIPAFRWFDKELGKTLAVGTPADLKIIEKRLSSGKGLLFNNGVSIGNLFSGDADETLLTVSSIGKKSADGLGHGYFAYFSNPYNLPRSVTLFLIDVVKEVKSIIEQGRRNVWPRLTHYPLIYPFLRASMTSVQKDIIVQTIIGYMYEGKDTIYADLVGYDEVSHHTGPERHETLSVLRDIDKQVKRLELAIKDSEKPYYLVILSDHGQTQGATFKQLMGYGLDKFVNDLVGVDGAVSSELDNKEDVNMINTAALEITKSGGLVGKSIGSVQKNYKKGKDEESSETLKEIKVLASGALGLIYFTKFKKRLTLEEIEELYPNLINGLISNPLVGFVLVNSKKSGPVVIGSKGKIFLKNNKVIGKNPLEIYGENSLEHVKRSNGFNNVADIMVNSSFDPILGEVHAFEELVGSHGAMGGEQMFPFVLFPSDWSYPDAHIMGAENLHLQLKKWLKQLGQKI